MKRILLQTSLFILSWTLMGSGLTMMASDSPAIETWSLDESTEVYFLEDSRAPLVYIQLNFPVNYLMPWAVENHAAAAFDCQMFAPERRLERRREQLGVSLSISMGWGYATIRGSSLTTDFAVLVELIHEVINNREYDKDQIRKWQRDRVIGWQANQTSPQIMLIRTAIENLFPDENDPRVRYYTRPSDVPKNGELLASVRDQIIATPGRNIAVSGQISKATLQDLLKDLLPEVNGDSIPTEQKLPARKFSANTEYQEDAKDLTQTYIGYMRGTLPSTSDQYPMYRLVNHALGGTFSSRLYERLRHESGDTYGVSLGQYFQGIEEGMLLIRTYTQTENADAAIAKLKGVLAEVSAKGITQSEVDAAIAYLEGREVFLTETPQGIVNRWALNKLLGRPGDFQSRTLQRAAEFSLAEINEFAADFYDPDRFALVKVVSTGSGG